MAATWRVADTRKTRMNKPNERNGTAMPNEILPLPAEWEKPITAYVRHQLGEGRLSPNTVEADRDALSHLGRRIGKGPWEVTYLDLVEFFADHPWSQNTKKSRRRAFVNFYAWAIDLEIFTLANPAARMRVPKVPKGTSTPTPDDVYELAVQLEPRADVRLMIRIAAETGLRRGEYAMVRREDVVLTREGWNLIVPRGKGNKRRVVMISPTLAVTMRDYVKEGYLFPGKKTAGHMSKQWAGVLVGNALHRAGWDGTGHGLRHKAANDLMRMTGNDILAVKAQLGHESISTTEGYIIPDMGKLRDVMNTRGTAAA